MTKPCILCCAITGIAAHARPTTPRCRSRIAEQVEIDARRPSRPAPASSTATSATTTERRPPTPSASRGCRRGCDEALPRHDRAVLDRRPLRRRPATAAACCRLRPDMASLSVGSNNFPTRVYENPPDLVDWLASEMLKYQTSSRRSRPSTSATSFRRSRMHARAGGSTAAALRPVRHGREERHAGRQRDLRLLRRDDEAAARRTPSGARRRDRPGTSSIAQRMVRSLPAGTPAPGSRTTCGSTATGWRLRMRR